MEEGEEGDAALAALAASTRASCAATAALAEEEEDAAAAEEVGGTALTTAVVATSFSSLYGCSLTYEEKPKYVSSMFEAFSKFFSSTTSDDVIFIGRFESPLSESSHDKPKPGFFRKFSRFS